MKDVVDKCSTKGCAIDVGTIIDNEDCVYRAEKMFPSREEAESTVAAVRERAAAAAPASEPPQATRLNSISPSLSPARRKRSFSSYPCEICFNPRPWGKRHIVKPSPPITAGGEGACYSKRQARFRPMP